MIWIRIALCPMIGGNEKKGPVLNSGLSKSIVVLVSASFLAVPFLHPNREGRAASGSRFSRAMASRPHIPQTALPRLRFTWAGDYSEGLAPVGLEGRFGFIDTAGDLRIAFRYEFAGGFSGNRAPVLLQGKWGYLDNTGNMAIPAIYAWAGSFREGLAPVSTEDGYLYIDTNGASTGPMRFAGAQPYSGGYAAVRFGEGRDGEESGAWGFLDRAGNLAIPPLFDDVPGGFSEGRAVVKVERERPFRSGYIDSSGGFVIDTLYDAAGDFNEGRAPVGRGEWRGNRFEGLWGYVDTTGIPVTPLTYLEAGPFQNGKALVRLMAGGGYALIDKNGRLLKGFRTDAEVWPGTGSGLVTFKLHHLFGFLDLETDGTLGPAFAEAGEMRQGRARVRLLGVQGANWAFVGLDGRFLGGEEDASLR